MTLEKRDKRKERARAPDGTFIPTHGAHSSTQLLQLQQEKYRELEAILGGEQAQLVKTDRIAVELLARNLAKIVLFDEYFMQNGFFTVNEQGKKDIAPLLKVYWQAVNAATRLCNALGLTPESRLRLGLQAIQSEDALDEIQRARDAKRDEIAENKDDANQSTT